MFLLKSGLVTVNLYLKLHTVLNLGSTFTYFSLHKLRNLEQNLHIVVHIYHTQSMSKEKGKLRLT